MIEAVGYYSFEDQRGFYDRYCVRIALADLVHPLIFMLDHGGMNDGVQFQNALFSGSRVFFERGLREAAAIDGFVGIDYSAAKTAHDFVVDRTTRLHEPVRDVIGFDEMRAEFHKQIADGGFAARD